VTHPANTCPLAGSRAANDGQDNVRARRSSGELPLTLTERILLFVGLDIASVLISFAERSRQPGTRRDVTFKQRRAPEPS
jgi:hypothetical protein